MAKRTDEEWNKNGVQRSDESVSEPKALNREIIGAERHATNISKARSCYSLEEGT